MTPATSTPTRSGFVRLRFWLLAGLVVVVLLGLYMLGVAKFAEQLRSDMHESYDIAPVIHEPVSEPPLPGKQSIPVTATQPTTP